MLPSCHGLLHSLPFFDHGQVVLVVKNLPADAVDVRDAGRWEFEPQVGKIPWRRARKPTPVFFPGESYAQRNLAGYSPWGSKKSDTTEAT